MRRAIVTVLVAACAVAGTGVSTPVSAETYRYWSYWQADGSDWRYATVGPGGSHPSDGSVEGWRFLVSSEGKSSPPRSPAGFDEICRGTEPTAGSKRVAVVVDYGSTGSAPEGEQPPHPRTACAQVPESATGADVLAEVAEPRFGDDALLCAIDSYPRSGCAEKVGGGESTGDGRGGTSTEDRNVPATHPARATDDGGPRIGLLVGIALVVGLGAAAWRARVARRP